MHSDDQVTHDVQALLRALDHPLPAVTADAIAERAVSRARVAPAWRWAAAVLLTLGVAGVAFALPGSPLRRWASELAALVAAWRHPEAPLGSGPPAQTAARGHAGIAVAPGRSLLIVFDRPAPDAVALVSVVGGAEVIVRAPAGAATFTTEADRLVIEGRDASPPDSAIVPDTFAVEIPRQAPRVEIRAGPARLFLKVGDRLISAQVPDAGGAWLLPLGTAGSPR